MKWAARFQFYFFISFSLIAFCSRTAASQDFISVKGKVVDRDTNEPVSFANVYFRNMVNYGAESNDRGEFCVYVPKNFTLPAELVCSFVGYETKIIKVNSFKKPLLIQLTNQLEELEEVVFKAKENPAFPIIRDVVRNRTSKTVKGFDNLRYRAYTNTQVFVSSFEQFDRFNVVKDIKSYMGSLDSARVPMFNGELAVPLLVNEDIVTHEIRDGRRTVQVDKKHVKGIGLDMDDNILTAGNVSILASVDILNDEVELLDKSLPSPLGRHWRANYHMWLIDSNYVHKGIKCYLIEVEPREKGNLVFEGKLMISKEDRVLVDTSLKLSQGANINFLTDLSLNQSFQKRADGFWEGQTLGMSYLLSDIFPGVPSLRIKMKRDFFQYKRNPVWPSEKPATRLIVGDSQENAEQFWKPYRKHAQAADSSHGQSYFDLVDTLNSLRSVRRTRDFLNTVSGGFVLGRYFDYGNYRDVAAYNSVEGFRTGLNIRTTRKLSNSWFVNPSVYYGFRDKRWKYNFRLVQNIKRSQAFYWQYWSQYELLGLSDMESNEKGSGNTFFLDRWKDYKNSNSYYVHIQQLAAMKYFHPFWRAEAKATYMSMKSINFSRATQGEYTRPGFDFPIETGKFDISVEYNPNNLVYFDRSNKLRYIPPFRKPIVRLGVRLGAYDNKIDGNIKPYQQIYMHFRDRDLKLVGFGRTSLQVDQAVTLNQLPYQLLKSHNGSGSAVFLGDKIEGMDNFEFVSDFFAEVRMVHYFQGRVANALPVFDWLNEKIGFRFLLFADAVWGGMSKKNKAYNREYITTGKPNEFTFKVLDPKKPYLDFGIGVENIFKVLRVDYVYRANYTDVDYKIPKSALKFTLQIKL
ncbi:MAG: DUF5686 and carboxypeptidase regulatory-like domain-containing protein [Cytophagales bacterium]|nr:DUF5686 and carboxypeptidase regulatory-like domain-containing protein [Cytophagales bacterium]